MEANSHSTIRDTRSESPYQTLVAEDDAMHDGDLIEATVSAKAACDRAYARLLALTADLDRRGVTDDRFGLSTKDWMRSSCRMTAREASGTVKTARALAEMPAVAEEAIAGRVVASGVKLPAMTRDRHPDEFADDETVFAESAADLDPKDLRKVVSRWEQDVDYDEAVADAEYDAWGRELFFNQGYGGRWDMRGEFGVADGNVINEALQGYIQRSFLDQSDGRAIHERLADAEVGIHRFWLDHNATVETSGGEKPHITVTVSYDVLTERTKELPELDGYAIDPTTLRRWTCDAGIVRIITDAGRRTRTIPQALRRALDLRDHGCTRSGCSVPAGWCDAHHIIHWADGGRTNLDNTQLLCRRHHTLTHIKERTRPPEP